MSFKFNTLTKATPPPRFLPFYAALRCLAACSPIKGLLNKKHLKRPWSINAAVANAVKILRVKRRFTSEEKLLREEHRSFFAVWRPFIRHAFRSWQQTDVFELLH